MKLIDFRVKKISGEKTGESLEGTKINTNIDISEVDEVKSGVFKGKEQILEIKFKYDLDYAPDYAKISFEGILLVGVDFKLSRDILKEWKEKKLPDDFKIDLLNLIIRKSGVRALQLEEDLNIPYHMKFPSLRKPVEAENAAAE